MTRKPGRNDKSYTRMMEELDKSVQARREENEIALTKFKTNLMSEYYEGNKRKENKINNLTFDLAEKATQYKISLIDKYAKKYAGTQMSSADIEKKIAKDVLDFIEVEKQQQRVQDYKEEVEHTYKVKNAKKQADIDIYNIRIQQAKQQTQIESDAKILAIKEASEKQGYVDAELHKFRLDTYTNELQTRLGIIENEGKQDLSKLQQSRTAKLQAQDALTSARQNYNAAIQSGDEAEIKAAQERVDKAQEEYDLKKKQYSDAKDQYKKDKKAQKDAIQAAKDETAAKMREEGATELEVMTATKQLSAEGVKEAIFSQKTATDVADKLISGLKQMFDSTIQTYGTYQAKINTRLQGSGKTWQGNAALGMFTKGMLTGGIESNLKLLIGANAYVKLQTVMDNVVKATEAGIASNVEQRAFLQTVSENIATTFDAFDANLLRIIRLQQADTTAARLGLEAGLTSFFNENFKDTNYLNSSFDSVSQNLTEAISQISAEEGVALEYTVQKWLGSLYSVGFSDSAVNKISQALGYLGSGNVNALSSDTDMQNLIVMAASRANMSYSDLLINGLDSSNTNKLLRSMVEYLGEIAESDNKVVKSEYARIFGMTVSDLKAVVNLQDDLTTISDSVMNYSGAMGELYSQMNELDDRISVAGKLQNLYDNVNYSIGTGIAGNPVTYALWQITSAIEDLTGGIALPTVSFMGNSVDLNTTVTNLMRTGIVGASTLGQIGTILSGLVSSVAPSSMLPRLGINNSSTAQQISSRGSGLSRKSKQVQEQSSSSVIGNSSGEDYYKSTLTSANDTTTEQLEQKKEETTDASLSNIHEYLVSVFDPKMTEIERLVALLAGYETKVESWGDFKGDINSNYKGTTVSIVNFDNKAIRKDTSDLLNSIKENTSNIYSLLQDVVSGDKSFNVSGIGGSTSIESSNPGF